MPQYAVMIKEQEWALIKYWSVLAGQWSNNFQKSLSKENTSMGFVVVQVKPVDDDGEWCVGDQLANLAQLETPKWSIPDVDLSILVMYTLDISKSR